MNLRVKIHNLILDTRRLERITSAPSFEKLYSSATEEQQTMMGTLVQEIACDKLITYLETLAPPIELCDQTLRELRLLASSLCIARYSIMSKEDLIRAIYEQRRHTTVVSQTPLMESNSTQCGQVANVQVC